MMAMMDSLPRLAMAAAGGCALGLVYFAGLWLTIRRLPTVRWPAVFSLASLLLRVAAALAGFYVIGAGDWRRLLFALAGFTAARMILARRQRGSATSSMSAEGDIRT
jgi:F1F0 ATPase subunit 2